MQSDHFFPKEAKEGYFFYVCMRIGEKVEKTIPTPL